MMRIKRACIVLCLMGAVSAQALQTKKAISKETMKEAWTTFVKDKEEAMKTQLNNGLAQIQEQVKKGQIGLDELKNETNKLEKTLNMQFIQAFITQQVGSLKPRQVLTADQQAKIKQIFAMFVEIAKNGQDSEYAQFIVDYLKSKGISSSFINQLEKQWDQAKAKMSALYNRYAPKRKAKPVNQ